MAQNHKNGTFLTTRVNGDLRVVARQALSMERGRRAPGAATDPSSGYDLDLTVSGRDGNRATEYDVLVFGLDGEEPVFVEPYDPSGRMTVHLPSGRYAVYARIFEASGDATLLVQPRLDLSGDRSVNLDARLGQKVSLTVPDPTAAPIFTYLSVLVRRADGVGVDAGLLGDDVTRWHVGMLGARQPVGDVLTKIGGVWTRDGAVVGSPYAFRLHWFVRGTVPTGFVRNVTRADLAVVRTSYGRATPDQVGWAAPAPRSTGFDDGGGWSVEVGFPLPSERTEYFTAGPDTGWERMFAEGSTADRADWITTLVADAPARYRAGHTYAETWNRGVFGPSYRSDAPSVRTGDEIRLGVPMYSDAADRWGFTTNSTTDVKLFRDGTPVGEGSGKPRFVVPPQPATYRGEVRTERTGPADLATRTILAWTFRSAHVEAPTPLPLSLVRFAPRLDAHNAAPAGAAFAVPLIVLPQPESTAGRPASILVDVSYDDGATWQRAPAIRVGTGAVVGLQHPATAGYVSLRATATDTAGNTVEQTIIRAYRLTSGA